MISSNEDYRGLSGNALKFIAALSMLIDHIGVMFLPDIEILRIIGRIAFPIYAFMIAEGCKYTKNKLRYFLTIFVLAVVCQIVYYFYENSLNMSILVTFSLSILVIYAMQYMKEALFAAERSRVRQCFSFLILLSVISGVYFLNRYLTVDYGFWGCMVPAFASVFRQTHSRPLSYLERLDRQAVHLLMLGIGLMVLSCVIRGNQPYCLFALPLLMLYSGKRGKWKMKAFFYVFYPAHFVILQCIFMLLNQ